VPERREVKESVQQHGSSPRVDVGGQVVELQPGRRYVILSDVQIRGEKQPRESLYWLKSAVARMTITVPPEHEMSKHTPTNSEPIVIDLRSR
jgi:hypothetical protein